MLISGLSALHIVSPFGMRVRNGQEEFHPGVDLRVYDRNIDPGATNILPIESPEKMKITAINLSTKWGHEILAEVSEKNPLGIIQFCFWHIKPIEGICEVGAELDEGTIFATPESGYVDLHLHFQTNIDYRGFTAIDPTKYFKYRRWAYA